ncbi:MAG: hypothetical protein ACOC1P_05885 [Minisyncoccales bacterium]
MSNVTAEVHELQGKHKESALHELLMRRERLINNSLALNLFLKGAINKVFKTSKKFKKTVHIFEEIAKKIEHHPQKADSLAEKLKNILEDIMKQEKHEPNIFESALKTIENIESNELNERQTFLAFLEKIVPMGYPKEKAKIASKLFIKHLKEYRQDLQSLRENYAELAGMAKDFALNRTVTKLQGLVKTTGIHQKWIFVPGIAKFRQKGDSKKLIKKEPKLFKKNLEDAVEAEHRGDATEVQKDLIKMTKIFGKEKATFEDLESYFSTEIRKFIRQELEVTDELPKLKSKLKKRFPELVKLISDFQTKLHNTQVDFANLLYRFRRGAVDMENHVGEIILHTQRLIQQVEGQKEIKLAA